MRARHFILLLLVLAVVAVWRPDWRVAAQRAVEPYAARVTASLRERMRASRAGPPTKAAPSPTPGGVTGRSRGGEIEQDEIPPRHIASSPVLLPAGNLPSRLPVLRPPPPLPASLRALRAAVRANPSAAGYRQLADAAASAGFPALAAEAYLQEAQVYHRLGDPNAAVVEEWKAGRYRAEGHLYLHSLAPPSPAVQTAQRLEPPYGAYLGAFIDRDD
jgi:hypothetical protein